MPATNQQQQQQQKGTPCVADDGLTIATRMLCAGLAGCTADVLTFPFDTIKVWLQVTAGSQTGVLRTIWGNVRRNGVTSLYGGLVAGLQRQVAFSSVRIGIYGNVKEFYCDLFGSTQLDVPIRVAAGTTTAMVAVAMFQPTEVVKIRMQAQSRGAKGSHQYPTTLHAYKHLWDSGVKEAWRGVGANATRLTVVNVSELVTYDIVKEQLLNRNIMNDTPGCHFVSACVAGLVTTIVASPVDVIKTRYMNSPKGKYSGPFDCLRATVRNNGFQALYRGFVPAYLRLGSWNIMMFLSYEQYKRIAKPDTDL